MPPNDKIPEPDRIYIEFHSDVPFVVLKVDDGKVIGETPDGEQIEYPAESDLHEITDLDL